ncbi:DUF914-domain-containing protein [Conidiobolus coronatus NRRL 28638]|uniref:DUF914-domain-containing protein n=1 Tax=Conidiobolus coronatus (strain ATCC 28846 / CBS 209.66 / NRRL 28638) TaxID=796925 RepID=A0A137PC85_CONC2|nr:DUF914-domain-containing protein [Conidiobolus coronatus NRRL 28638]|eukprot:KXN72585.1 DUF914-domain-containing protein [Conidiobolus coronatus NRRL 28638]
MNIFNEKLYKVIGVILFGQLLSLCITGTNTTTNLLVEELQKPIPMIQSFFTYVFLALIFIPFSIYKGGFRHFGSLIKQRWYIIIFWALMDVEGNYFVVKGFSYTNLISAMLIGSWSTPACVILSFFFLKTRYRWTHLVGIVIALGGLGLLIYSDFITDKTYEGKDVLKGDLFCLVGATFYACSNIIQEFFVHQIEFYEVIALLGLFGLPIAGIQLGALESNEFSELQFTSLSITYISVFTIIMVLLYSLTPILMKLSSATFFNISLLSSDFYTLIIGLLAFKVPTHEFYYIAFTLVVIGLFIFNIFPSYKKGENLNNPADVEADVETHKEYND